MKSCLLGVVCASIFTLSVSRVSDAALVVFDNLADYNGNTGSELFLIDFNGSPDTRVDGSTISSLATFTSPEASDPSEVDWSSDALTDAGSIFVGVGPLAIEFSSPVFALALDFLSAAEQETVNLFDSSAASLGSVVAPNASGFFGVVSDTAIASVLITPGGPSATPDRFFIDNLRANAPVPIPAALYLFASGLIGLFGMARRKAA